MTKTILAAVGAATIVTALTAGFIINEVRKGRCKFVCHVDVNENEKSDETTSGIEVDIRDKKDVETTTEETNTEEN